MKKEGLDWTSLLEQICYYYLRFPYRYHVKKKNKKIKNRKSKIRKGPI
jgi:hypothetical protein